MKRRILNERKINTGESFDEIMTMIDNVRYGEIKGNPMLELKDTYAKLNEYFNDEKINPDDYESLINYINEVKNELENE